MKKRVEDPVAFHWRGGDVSRLEGFSDNVFGFALTLLVVSLEVPKSFGDLMATMRGFMGFAVCFGLLAVIWFDHYQFHRRYGLNDTWTVVLNLVLLFIVMFYVYPLKFLFTYLITVFFHVESGLTMPASGWPTLMMIYGTGFAAVYTVFILLYMNAYRQREALDLNELEVFDTRAAIGSDAVLVSIGVTSIILASFRTNVSIMLSGMLYWLIGISMSIYWSIAGKRRRPLEERHLASMAESATP